MHPSKHYRLIRAGIMASALALSIPTMTLASTSTANESTLSVLHIFGANMGLSDKDPRAIIASLIRSGMGFVGIIVLLMILWSGLQFMVSGGDKEKTDSAKKTFFNTIIGLLIMLCAYSIVAFVLNAFGSTTNVPL